MKTAATLAILIVFIFAGSAQADECQVETDPIFDYQYLLSTSNPFDDRIDIVSEEFDSLVPDQINFAFDLLKGPGDSEVTDAEVYIVVMGPSGDVPVYLGRLPVPGEYTESITYPELISGKYKIFIFASFEAPYESFDMTNSVILKY